MIDPRGSDMLLYVTAVTVAIGMVVMLFGLLVPREVLESASQPQPAYSAASASLAHMIADGPAVSGSEPAHLEAPPLPSKEATFAAIVAEAKRQVEEPVSEFAHDTEIVEADGADDFDAMLRAPLVSDLTDEQQHVVAPVDRSALAKRITWPRLVDETAIDCDLPTRLRLIEGLSFIGGSWSIDILARAYEQELDANVRGAIFVALRDARSAA